jgi:hypothetical protein
VTIKEELYAIWSIEEMLLQSYRAIFITMQSILIAAFAAFPTTNMLGRLALAIFGLIGIPAWVYVTERRQRYLDIVQFLLKCCDAGTLPLTESGRSVFRHAQKTGTVKLTSLAEPAMIYTHPQYGRRGFGSARLVIGALMPLSFAILWLVLMVAR